MASECPEWVFASPDVWTRLRAPELQGAPPDALPGKGFVRQAEGSCWQAWRKELGDSTYAFCVLIGMDPVDWVLWCIDERDFMNCLSHYERIPRLKA